MGFKENAGSALRGWGGTAVFVLIALAGLALVMFAPELDKNPLVYISPG